MGPIREPRQVGRLVELRDSAKTWIFPTDVNLRWFFARSFLL